MKKVIIFLMFFASFGGAYAQNSVSEQLIAQGAWFLFSTRTDEYFNDETLTKVDFFKKEDVSSIFFDNEDKMFSVFSKDGSDMWEDLWRIVDDTHFLMVSLVDDSKQLMDIVEFTSTKLVLRNCSDIDEGSKCMTYTYFSTKEEWLSDSEIDELNSAGIIEVEN